MARPSKKAANKAQEASKALDRIFAEVDPQLAAAGLLGGMAAVGGIVPPFTRLLSMLAPGTDKDVVSAQDRIIQILGFPGPNGEPPGIIGLLMGGQGGSNATGGPVMSVEAWALFASGALEGMLMFKAFSSPEIMKAVIGMPAEMLKGIGEIVPG
jgi:hypothetical protein